MATGGLRGEVREYGRIANTPTALNRLLRKLGGDGVSLRFCYEAGPCGYGIQRQVSATGHDCVVVDTRDVLQPKSFSISPSSRLYPRRAGDGYRVRVGNGVKAAALRLVLDVLERR